MKKTSIVIVLVILVVGAWLFLGSGKKVEAPLSGGYDSGNSAAKETTNKVVTPTPTPTSTTPKTNTITPKSTVSTTVVPTVPAVKEFVVNGKNFSFTPSLITVKKGDIVKITFTNSDGFHNFVIDEFNVTSKTIQSGSQDSIQFTAGKVGSFEYYCAIGSHRAMGMKGTLKVE